MRSLWKSKSKASMLLSLRDADSGCWACVVGEGGFLDLSRIALGIELASVAYFLRPWCWQPAK